MSDGWAFAGYLQTSMIKVHCIAAIKNCVPPVHSDNCLKWEEPRRISLEVLSLE